MMKSTMNMVKGVGIGMLAGAAVTVVGSQMMKTDKKHLKKSAGKAMKTVSDVLDAGYRTADIMSEGKTQVKGSEMTKLILERI